MQDVTVTIFGVALAMGPGGWPACWKAAPGRIDREDESTLTCPCGASFTWSSFDDRLRGWVLVHRPHCPNEGETPQ